MSIGEIVAIAVAGLAADQRFADLYTAFIRDMVYGEAADFKTALATVAALADGLKA